LDQYIGDVGPRSTDSLAIKEDLNDNEAVLQCEIQTNVDEVRNVVTMSYCLGSYNLYFSYRNKSPSILPISDLSRVYL